MQSEQMSRAVEQSLLYLSAWGRATKEPVQVPEDTEVVTIYKPAPVSDKFIGRDNLDVDCVRMYDSVTVGQTYKLCAGTGCGKSTKVPCLIASLKGTIGVVVVPDRQLMRHVYKYVRGVLAPREYKSVNVVCASSFADVCSTSSPAVVYVAAMDFLSILLTNASGLAGAGVGFVYVDEAHEHYPEYYVLRLLCGAGKLGGVKLFLGSATSTEISMEFRSGGVKQSVAKVSVKDVCLDSPSTMTTKSPLHHTRIVNRTLVFVHQQKAMYPLLDYYESNAVRVFMLDETAARSELYEVIDVLKRGAAPVVVMATQRYQTGYTLDFDTVIDCGVSVDMVVDYGAREFSLSTRREYDTERVQRCGRVGRHISGTAYCLDGEPGKVTCEVMLGYDVYVVLWCVLFSVKVNVPMVKNVEELFGPITKSFAAAALHCNMHPALLRAYTREDGSYYGNIGKLLSALCPSASYPLGPVGYQVDPLKQHWLERKVAGVPWLTQSALYMTPFTVPHEWVPYVYALSKLAASMDSDAFDFDVSDAESVYTVAAPLPPVGFHRRRDSKFKRDTVTTLATPAVTLSGFDFGSIASPRPPVPVVPRTFTSCDQLPRSPGLPPVVSQFQTDSVSVRSRTHHSRGLSGGSRRSSYVDSAREKFTVSRIHITVDKLVNQRLFPYDEELYKSFVLAVDIRNSEDTGLFDKLVKGKLSISKAPYQECCEQFMSVMRVWNGAVIQSYQVKAKPKGFFNHDEETVCKLVKRQCKDLFRAFDFRHLYLSVESSTMQTGRVGIGETYTLTLEEATYELEVGNSALREAVLSVKARVRVRYVGDEQRGLYLAMEDYTMGVYHVFGGADAGIYAATPPSHVIALRCDPVLDYILYVHSNNRMPDLGVVLRKPVTRESVLVITVVPGDARRLVTGPYQVVGDDQEWYYDGSLGAGMSGSVLVAVADGAVVGLHIGRFAVVDGKVLSSFVSSHNYLDFDF